MMRNFGVVEPGFFRSGKYLARELEELTRFHLGLTVVDLRDRTRRPLLSSSTYRKLGAKLMRVPLEEREPIPDDALTSILLQIKESRPILIHCWKGSHRTGAVVAHYRLRQQWSEELILAELVEYGYGRIESKPELLHGVIKGC